MLLTVFPRGADIESKEQRQPIMVSLGDSYSSGEGVEPFYGQGYPMSVLKDDPDWLAHRSSQSWPGKLWIPGVQNPMSYHRNSIWYFVAS